MIFALAIVMAVCSFMLGMILQGSKKFNTFTNLDTRKWIFYTVSFSAVIVALLVMMVFRGT